MRARWQRCACAAGGRRGEGASAVSECSIAVAHRAHALVAAVEGCAMSKQEVLLDELGQALFEKAAQRDGEWASGCQDVDEASRKSRWCAGILRPSQVNVDIAALERRGREEKLDCGEVGRARQG